MKTNRNSVSSASGARFAALLVLTGALGALAAPPDAATLLRKYDEIMGPKTFEAEFRMTAQRDDGSQRVYGMRVLKGEGDRIRLWFHEPAQVRGQEMLRSGDNLWLYLPNLKRPTRMANRESFQGGDFNNADVLRVNYSADYEAKLIESTVPQTYALELKAKTASTAYEMIRLWLRQSDSLPVKAQYFGSSGQMLRSAEFSDYQTFDKRYVRPAKVRMQNEIAKARWSLLEIKSFKLNAEAPSRRFAQADLGK